MTRRVLFSKALSVAPPGLLLDHVEGLVLARSWAQGPLLPWPFEFQLCSANQRSKAEKQVPNTAAGLA